MLKICLKNVTKKSTIGHTSITILPENHNPILLSSHQSIFSEIIIFMFETIMLENIMNNVLYY